MDWTKIPTTIISKRYSDYEILSIVKFQLVWAMNEEQPDKTTALRYMTAKQYETAMTYLDSISSTVSDEVSSVKQKRCAEKIRYSKNKELLKILPTDCKQTVSSPHEQIRENKIKEEKEIHKEKENNNRYGELKNVILTQEQYETLTEKYPNLDMAIEKLDTWLGTSGSKNKNKNHFAYFKSNSWVWENLPKGEVKTQNIKPNTLPVDIDLWNGEYYDFNLSKAVAKAGDNPDWSKYNRKTGTFDL